MPWPKDRVRIDHVPNDALREAFEDSVVDARTVALRCDWVRPCGKPEGDRVARALGLRRRGNGDTTRYLSEPVALKLGDALGLDPWEVGL